MSSPEEDNNENSVQNLKKRRVQRACDICRRKKVRCDGGQMPGHRCSNCVTYNYECTYVEAAKKRGPPKGYVESLENRLQKMETLLHKLCPDADFTQELGGNLDKDNWYSDRERAGSSSSALPGAIPPPAPSPDADGLEPSDDEVIAQRTLTNSLKQMKLNPGHIRFFGKSSSAMFIQTAIEAKNEYAGIETPPRDSGEKRVILPAKRPHVWGIHPWILPTLQADRPHQDFPEPDLLADLTDLFFENINNYYPLMHRPTFDQDIQNGLHFRDEGFGSVVLLMCAVASRFSDDPRVFLADSDSSHSCGWKYFTQVQMVRRSLLAAPRLYDLQLCFLTSIYLQSTSAPQACWTVIGVGIRLAQDVGAHRRKVYSKAPTVEDELWKRAFWCLVSLDRIMSITLGRPCAIQDEDFDLELPVECDDEYWIVTDTELRFQQPPNKPSKITFFNCFLRLNQILAFALRTIYSINKSKTLLGFVGQQWEQHIVAELDSALNKWIDSVPEHLRWDPNREDMLFLNQSAFLYSHYYQLQIAVHRPFIPSPRKPSPLSFPSLAICTNAARSCTHVLDVPFRRSHTVLFYNQIALFTSAIVLLLNIWGGKRSGLSTDPAKEMADVHKCMRMLKHLEPRWHTAGRLWDVLYELASVGDLPLPQASPAPSQKRERGSDSPPTSNVPTPSSAYSPAESVRSIAGSKRVSYSQAQQQQQPISSLPQQPQHPAYPPNMSVHSPASSISSANAGNHFALPIYTEELGRIPIHPGINNSDPLVASGWHTSSPMSTMSMSALNTSAAIASSSSGPHSVDTNMDPGLSSIFDMSPSMFDQMMTSFAGPIASSSAVPHGFGGAVPPGLSGLMGGGMAAAPGGSVATFGEGIPNWPNGPLEWEDWGTYITSVTGMGSQTADSDRYQGER